MKVLVVNGPNLNLLGVREKEIYGSENYQIIIKKIKCHAKRIGIKVTFFQSNHEGALVDAIQKAYGKKDGIIINPGAYTHTSVALLDAVKAVSIPAVEVHISDPDLREPFRKISYIRSACITTIKGQGTDGYCQALSLLKTYWENKNG